MEQELKKVQSTKKLQSDLESEEEIEFTQTYK